MAEITLIMIVAGLLFGLIPALRWALSAPISSPREVAGYVLVAILGVAYLLIVGIDPLASDGTGAIAYLGAGALGVLLLDGGAMLSRALPGGEATGSKR